MFSGWRMKDSEVVYLYCSINPGWFKATVNKRRSSCPFFVFFYKSRALIGRQLGLCRLSKFTLSNLVGKNEIYYFLSALRCLTRSRTPPPPPPPNQQLHLTGLDRRAGQETSQLFVTRDPSEEGRRQILLRMKYLLFKVLFLTYLDKKKKRIPSLNMKKCYWTVSHSAAWPADVWRPALFHRSCQTAAFLVHVPELPHSLKASPAQPLI